VAVLEQELLGLRSRLRQRRLEALRDGSAHFALAPGVRRSQLLEIGDDRIGVDELDGWARHSVAVQHHPLRHSGAAAQCHRPPVVS